MSSTNLSPLILVLLCFGCLLAGSACDPSGPYPEEKVPTLLTDGQYCLSRLNKSIDGYLHVSDSVAATYPCDSGEIMRSTAELSLRIFNQQDCDDNVLPLPPSGNVLVANGTVYYQSDGLAQFIGDFAIRHVPSAPAGTFFTGKIELIARIGTHQVLDGPDCQEPCGPDRHLEGWISGVGVGELANYMIRASLALDMSDNLPVQGVVHPSSRLTGIVFTALP
jgi:hypothetical protein